ncbi:MAG TPA: hypothetical protein VMS17_05430 [Gemmataceae bacterium]|nr:hypothetical protein [Gemmataceae bacterium]
MALLTSPRNAGLTRSLLRIVILYSAFLILHSAAAAAEPLHIENVQIGLPGGKGEQESTPYRSGLWAPVYVKIKAGPDGNGLNQFVVRVESSDGENALVRYETPLPALTANEDYIAVAYVRPAGNLDDFSVHLVTADGQPVLGGPAVPPPADKQPLEPAQPLYLSIGSRLARNMAGDQGEDKQKQTTPFAYIDDVSYMPDRWFGYEAVDCVVLTTGGELIKTLLEDSAADRRRALAEWVRRGGKLIVSVGANRQLAADLLKKMPLGAAERAPLIPCDLDGPPVTCAEAVDLSHWLGPAKPLERVEFTHLRPGAGVVVLVSEACKDQDGAKVDCPVLVESSCGLGRVWLTAFDLETGPFGAKDAEDSRKAFWAKVQTEFTPRLPVPADKNGFNANEPQALLADLERSLDDFENVPVVNFGWVALFILVYIAIVGPLDYILLTRLFKRPELTWITFPVVVVSLSILAYVTAYSMKGDDLRVIKMDLVEYDLGDQPQAYGTSWFTLFSPRIQNCTIGLEPSAPDWASPPAEGTTNRAVMVAALTRAGQADAAGSPSLFRKPYDYAPDAFGVEHTPIPVWSTRAFQASWRAGVDKEKPPVADGTADKTKPDPVRADPADANKLIGTIRNNLPVALESVTIFYRGNYYAAPDLAPGAEFHVQALWQPRPGKDQPGLAALGWAGDASVLTQPIEEMSEGRSTNRPYYVPAVPRNQLMKDMLFHTKTTGASAKTNIGLRVFDQSWRLDEKKVQVEQGKEGRVFRDEIILVARTSALSDQAAKAMNDPACPTRLWIDRLPDGKSKPPIPSGYLTQETYVRVYIPVQHPQPDKAVKP